MISDNTKKQLVEIYFPKISLRFGDCSLFTGKPVIAWNVDKVSSFIHATFSDDASNKEEFKSKLRDEYHCALDKALDYYIREYVQPKLDEIGGPNATE